MEPLGDVPPFPSEHRPPIAKLVSIGDYLSMFPRNLRPGHFSAVNDATGVSITIPTAPRLNILMKESLCIKRWAVCSLFLPETTGLDFSA